MKPGPGTIAARAYALGETAAATASADFSAASEQIVEQQRVMTAAFMAGWRAREKADAK